jgi:hypothetical protein
MLDLGFGRAVRAEIHGQSRAKMHERVYRQKADFDRISRMSFPIKTCVVCGEEFELKPDKPGFANRCPECSSPEAEAGTDKPAMSAEERKALSEVNAERRKVIRDMLYRKDR